VHTKGWLIILMLVISIGTTACVETVRAEPNPPSPSKNVPKPVADFWSELGKTARASWDALGSTGGAVSKFGESFPNCLGLLVCLAIPLSLLGLWTLSNIGSIFGMASFRANVRSFMRD